MDVFVCVRVYICVCARARARVCVHVPVRACLYVCVRACACVCVRPCVCVCVDSVICSCVRVTYFERCVLRSLCFVEHVLVKSTTVCELCLPFQVWTFCGAMVKV